jgi:endoglucanase
MLLVAAIVSATIRVDQVGYPANAPKIALVWVRASARTPRAESRGHMEEAFEVLRDNGIIFTGKLSPPVVDRDSGDRVGLADFSAVRTPGEYTLRFGEDTATVVFANDPYASLLRLTTRAYTGQRCGTAVDLGDGYAHPTCHLESAFHSSSGRSGPAHIAGGWHDAGDYGRYVVNSGISTGTLLWACELFHLDMLDEVRWNVEWMLSMQDTDGGVWHKETSEVFPPFVAPQDDHSVQYVIGKGSCATGDFAAVMAIAARLYHRDDLLVAARRAFAWLHAHPNVTFRNPPGVLTGEYGDRDCSDERLWAAAELWRTDGDKDAHAYFVEHAQQAVRDVGPPDWQHVGALAAWSFAFASASDERISAAIRQRTIESANDIVRRANANAYRIPLYPKEYVWGSNAVAANYGLELLIANEFHHDPEYVNATLDIIHYLLGRNSFSLSWVTGTGTNPVMHPHHRPSATDGIEAPWPGLLAGGPNRNRQDPVLRKLPRDLPPARNYVDDQESYASNEVAINWNAPFVFILAGTQATK